MALLAGQCTTDSPAPTGLAGAIFAELQSRSASLGFTDDAFTEGSDARGKLAALVEAIAAGVVDHLTTQGQTKITLASGLASAGLQSVGGVATDGPLSTKYVYGAIE